MMIAKGIKASKELTPNELFFIEEFIKTGNGRHAVRVAFDATNDTPTQQHIKYRDLMKSTRIQKQLALRRKELETVLNITKESLVQRLVEIDKEASAAGAYSASIAAVQTLCKMLGYYEATKIMHMDGKINVFMGGYNPDIPPVLNAVYEQQRNLLIENNSENYLSINHQEINSADEIDFLNSETRPDPTSTSKRITD